jgi:hypothetical protein
MKACVYLSDSIAPMFAAWCQNESEGEDYALTPDRGLVIEIDTDWVDEEFLLPDEDFLKIAVAKNDGHPMPMPCDPADVLTLMMANAELWKASLSVLGTCAHLGDISPKAITRVALFKRDAMHLARFDNSVNPMAFYLMAQTHRENLAFLFDGTLPSPPPVFFELGRFVSPGHPEYESLVQTNNDALIAHRSRTVEVLTYDRALQTAGRRDQTQRRGDGIAAS